METDINDIVSKADEIHRALEVQTRKSDRIMQRAADLKEVLPDLKDKMKYTGQSFSRIRLARDFSVSNRFTADISQTKRKKDESSVIDKKNLSAAKQDRRKASSMI